MSKEKTGVDLIEEEQKEEVKRGSSEAIQDLKETQQKIDSHHKPQFELIDLPRIVQDMSNDGDGIFSND